MPETEESHSRKLAIKFKTVEGAPYIYSDYVNLNIGFFGVKLAFGTMDAVRESPDLPEVTMLVQIGMSAEHAKALHDLLGRQLAIYEEKWGPMREPRIDDDDSPPTAPSDD